MIGPASPHEKKQPSFSMATGNMKHLQECFPKHLRTGTARIKLDIDTEEESKKREVNMERSKVDTKKIGPTAYNYSSCLWSPRGLLFPEAVAELPNEPSKPLNLIHCPLGRSVNKTRLRFKLFEFAIRKQNSQVYSAIK